MIGLAAADVQTYCRGMEESPYLSVIRVWAAAAWADGVIDDAEAAAMKRLVAVADLSEQERATAHTWLETKVELETDSIAGLSDSAREGIYRAAVRLAAVDRDVATEELTFLSRLRDGLTLSEGTAKQIESGVPGFAEAKSSS